MKVKYSDAINALKSQLNENTVASNVVIDDIKSQLTRYRTSDGELRKQMDRLREEQQKAGQHRSSRKSDVELIESLKTQRDNV